MNSRDFCYWLQGYFELTDSDSGKTVLTGISPEAALIIQDHLNMVFLHEIDPSFGPKEHQAKLNTAHGDANGYKMRC